jgi:hypothetical protein
VGPATVWGGAVQMVFESDSKIETVYFNSKSFQTLTGGPSRAQKI